MASRVSRRRVAALIVAGMLAAVGADQALAHHLPGLSGPASVLLRAELDATDSPDAEEGGVLDNDAPEIDETDEAETPEAEAPDAEAPEATEQPEPANQANENDQGEHEQADNDDQGEIDDQVDSVDGRVLEQEDRGVDDLGHGRQPAERGL